MRPRTIAIGDIHGCSRALEALLAAIGPRPEDVIVTLGDYVNRGPDSRGVLDRLIALEGQCTLVPILGNHDQTLLSRPERRATRVVRSAGHGGACDARIVRCRANDRGPIRRRSPLSTSRSSGDVARTTTVKGNFWSESRPNTSRSSSAVATTTRPRRTSSSTPSTTRTWRWRTSLLPPAVGVAPRRHPRPARLGQDGDRRPHLAEERRDPRPRPPGLHRHILLRRRLADRTGCPHAMRSGRQTRRASCV